MLPVYVSDKPFTEDMARRLCECVAHSLEDSVEVARDLGITPAALATLLEERPFLDAVLAERAVWNAPDNAARRTKTKADIALEETIVRLHEIAHDRQADPADSIRAVQTLKSMTTLQAEQDRARAANAGAGGPASGEGFKLTIVMPRADGTNEPIVIGRGEARADADEARPLTHGSGEAA